LLLVLVVGLVPGLAAAPANAAEGEPLTGILIVDHGEPPEYNELTYESFKKFFNHLMEMGVIPAWLKNLETGTITQDTACYSCASPAAAPDLIDAWLDPQTGPGVYVPPSDSLPGHYVVAGGPGLGEPDIFEHMGLQVWNEWNLMGGVSPNYAEKLAKKQAVIARLRAHYGSELPIRIGYGIDPRIDGSYQGMEEALHQLVDEDGVKNIVVAYHGVGFSDMMQTHMIRHEIEEILTGFAPDVTVSYAKPIGVTGAYVEAVVRKVKSELKQVPESEAVAIHLSGHGIPTDMCGDYNCGEDSYHESSLKLFKRVKKAIMARVDRKGEFGVFHLYGEGAAEEDDPDDEVDSPIEALDERKAAGFERVIDIPYEFDSNSRDTLIVLRQGYEREIPDWNEHYESNFTYEGMPVKITDCTYGKKLKVAAFTRVIKRAYEKGGGGHHHH
jgi:hypothetical protein